MISRVAQARSQWDELGNKLPRSWQKFFILDVIYEQSQMDLFKKN
jgi:hypothetical protein